MEETGRDNEVMLMVMVTANMVAMVMVLGRVMLTKVTVMAKMLMILKMIMTMAGRWALSGPESF